MPRIPDSDRVFTTHALGLIRGLLATFGIEWEQAAAAVGFRADIPITNSGLMPFRQYLALCEYLASASGDDAIGVQVGDQAMIGGAGVYDYVAVTSPSLRAGIGNWLRYHPIASNAIVLGFEEAADAGRLIWGIEDGYGPRVQFIGWTMALFQRRIRHMAGDDRLRLGYRFAHPQPASIATYEQLLGPDLLFDQPRDLLTIPVAALDAVPPLHEPFLHDLMQQLASRELEQREKASDRLFLITRQISEGLAEGDLSLDRVAACLSMSPRKLQRSLEAMGTSFRELSEQMRRQIAQRYLAETALPVKEIARLTGFADQTAFSRAVKSWFGRSPVELRRASRARSST